jgi:hypothetical protein
MVGVGQNMGISLESTAVRKRERDWDLRSACEKLSGQVLKVDTVELLTEHEM